MSQTAGGSPRVAPHNLNAEKSVLCAMMLSQEAASEAYHILKTDDFYFEAHRMIFSAMSRLQENSQPVDFITVSEILDRENRIGAVGGYDYLSEINSFLPSAAHVADYIEIVYQRSMLRRLIAAANGILEDCYGDRPVSEVMERAEKAIFALSQARQSKNFVKIREAIDKALERVEMLSEDPNAMLGIRTGFVKLDEWLSGLKPSELVLLAARPSMGKTAFALNIAQQAARMNADATIAIFSLEMPYEDIAARMLANVGNLPLQNLRTGRLAGSEWNKLTNATGILGPCSIFIDDSSDVNVVELRSKCRRLQMEHGLNLIIIDYLQLLSGTGNSTRSEESRQQEISAITRMLKVTARELNVPILVLSQLSRAPERRADHRPQLSDLRDSGAIEQDADVVMFLYRDSYGNYAAGENGEARVNALNPNEAEVLVAKNRNGPTGTVKVIWDAESASYVNPPEDLRGFGNYEE